VVIYSIQNVLISGYRHLVRMIVIVHVQYVELIFNIVNLIVIRYEDAIVEIVVIFR
jgi:hypothetical protein